MLRILVVIPLGGAVVMQPPKQQQQQRQLLERHKVSSWPETMVPRGDEGEGVYAQTGELVARIDGLRSWANFYEAPWFLTNGHAHTIWASKLRTAPSCRYGRILLPTPDGGTLALDCFEEALETSQPRVEIEIRDEWAGGDGRPVVLLLSGLGGGSQDTYVRSTAAAAAARGFDAVVLNMRSCGDSPVTSPRFFSAYLGSTDDVAVAVDYIRERRRPSAVAAVGWSNSGTIVVNTLAGLHADIDAACALAAPLNMPVSSANLERWFHSAVYDRAIGSSLAEKFRKHRSLFEDSRGPKPVPAYRHGQTFVADVDLAAGAASIRAIDEALTAPCFGFDGVDSYYQFSSAHQRLSQVQTPLLLVNAADDPIARLGDVNALVADVTANPNLIFALTTHGGHLGWVDPADPRGEPAWMQRTALDFLQTVLTDTA